MASDNKPQECIAGAELYFSNINIHVDDLPQIKENVAKFQNHIKHNENLYPLTQIEKNRYFSLDILALINDNIFLQQWPNFKNNLTSNPEYTLNCVSLAMYNYIYEIHKNTESVEKKIPTIRARIYNLEPVIGLRDINASYFGKLVSLKGTVIKASPTEIRCTYMAFHCPICNSNQLLKQQDGCYTPLGKCQICRNKGIFKPLYKSSDTRTIDWQTIGIQEIDCDLAMVPQVFECVLTEDLVKSCLPGDDITIYGIIKAKDPNDNKGKNKQNTILNLYLKAVSVYNNKNECGGLHSSTCDRITFTPQDYLAIKQIHAQPNLFRYLVHSLCPMIYGHEIVKAGLLLALFRGTKSSTSRAESHVLLMGDPGLGKSQMLKSCANVSPRGVYVCGNVSTTSGLTVTMTRESCGEYSMEAGALMIADQGCCCIDEFDKMPTQHTCLLEAMEQQTISIAKAGVVCCLHTKPTILVAANPVGGHYNKSKTIGENLKISSPMLSRFDLIFILLDQPNENLDKYLSKHVLSAHLTNRKQYTPKEFRMDNDEDDYGLKDKLKLDGQPIEPLQHTVFRKYIAYSQKYVNPRLSNEAKEILMEFYVSLRKQFATGDCTPVTVRQLQSMIRLTQARAKLELREEASEDDAKDVIEIMKYSLKDVFTNQDGELDKSRSQMGSGMSYKNLVMKLLDVLQSQSEIHSKSLFTLQEIREASENIGLAKDKFFRTLSSLNMQGFLLSKGRDTYQLNSAYL